MNTPTNYPCVTNLLPLLPLVEEYQVKEHLSRLKIEKPMGLDVVHPQVLRWCCHCEATLSDL